MEEAGKHYACNKKDLIAQKNNIHSEKDKFHRDNKQQQNESKLYTVYSQTVYSLHANCIRFTCKTYTIKKSVIFCPKTRSETPQKAFFYE